MDECKEQRATLRGSETFFYCFVGFLILAAVLCSLVFVKSYLLKVYFSLTRRFSFQSIS